MFPEIAGRVTGGVGDYKDLKVKSGGLLGYETN